MSLLIIDGSSIGSRAFHSSPISFFNMVETVRAETFAEYMVFCFDDNQPSFRQKLYPEYKGGRKRNKDREYFITAVAVALEQTGYAVHWGPEADDTIGRIVHSTDMPAVIFSSDTDLWQLVQGQAVLCMWCGQHFKDRQIIGESEVIDRYGVPPAMLPEYIGLAGESSDNIPGVTGIGSKGASALLAMWGNAGDLFAFADKVEGRYAKAIQAPTARKQFELSKTLATIKLSPEIKIDWAKAEYKPLTAAVKRWLASGN